MAFLIDIKNTAAQRWNSLDESWRLAIMIFVVARLVYGLWSWVVFTVQPVAIQNLELFGEPVVTIFRLRDSQSYIYRRDVEGTNLSFRPFGIDQMVDQQTGTVWNITNGKAIQGQYKNSLAPAKTQATEVFPYHGMAPYPALGLAIWQRFDANWYISIAKNGYGSIPGDVHFPPLYPLLMRLLNPIFNNLFLAGLFISNLALLYALKLLYDLYLEWGDRTTARQAVLFFVIYPTFFFCFSAYTEPLFLVTTLLAFKAMHIKSWHWAGFWIFCSILIRLQGMALLAPLLFLMWRDPPFLRKAAHWACLVFSGAAGMLYLSLRSMLSTEAALPFVESNLHARLVMPWQSFGYAIKTILDGRATFIDLLNLATLILFIFLLIWGWKKIPLAYQIYTVCSLLMVITRVVETQPLVSFSRYSLTFFPVFFTLAVAGKQPWVRRMIVYASVLLSLYLSGQFFVWGWVA